ncbi:MAG: hypothetical protein KJO26_09070, partial [Deltaproteobacteria bacterium]|nr:hypothetical protein [Deltaproteobacteria bacterium]
MKNKMGTAIWLLVVSLFMVQSLFADSNTDVTTCGEFVTDHTSSRTTIAAMVSETGLKRSFQEKIPFKSIDTDHDFSKTVDSTNQQPQHYRKSMPDKRHYASIIIGAVNWPNLGDIDPSQAGFNPQQFGKFKTWCYNIEIAYHYLA